MDCNRACNRFPMLHIIQDPCSHPAILKAFQTINAKANLIIFRTYCYTYPMDSS